MQSIRGIGLGQIKNSNDASHVGKEAKRDVSLTVAVSGCTVVRPPRFLKRLRFTTVKSVIKSIVHDRDSCQRSVALGRETTEHQCRRPVISHGPSHCELLIEKVPQSVQRGTVEPGANHAAFQIAVTWAGHRFQLVGIG